MNANEIRRLREAKDMSPTELAFRVRRSQTTIWRYESGEAVPSLATARRIAEVLDCTVDDLFPLQETEAA